MIEQTETSRQALLRAIARGWCHPNTIEQKVYDAMLSKDARMTNLLDLFSTL